MLPQHSLGNVHPPGGLDSSHSRKCGSNLPRGTRDDLRADVRTHGLSTPHPRNRHQALKAFARPALAEGSARNGSHLTNLARARSHNARGRAPSAPQPHSGTPPGAEASTHVARPSTEEHLLAEFIAVATAQLAEKPLER
eukprot:9866502-Alexandrium_andersonii.AAC.1